jgi:archaellum biogenesis ATPase FlaH
MHLKTIKRATIQKSLTGVTGFDEISGGGLPSGRPSLFCGSAGCGKTLFAMEFLVRGALEFGEPGVFVSFEETSEDLVENVASLGFDLDDLVKRGLSSKTTCFSIRDWGFDNFKRVSWISRAWPKPLRKAS